MALTWIGYHPQKAAFQTNISFQQHWQNNEQAPQGVKFSLKIKIPYIQESIKSFLHFI